MSETTRNRLMLAIALVLAAIYLFPLYWMYVTALKTGSAMFATPPSFWPSDPQWGTYVYVWESRNLARYMWNSLIIAFGAYFARFIGTVVTTYCRNVGIGDAGVIDATGALLSEEYVAANEVVVDWLTTTCGGVMSGNCETGSRK
mgnify:CR=1 FL=1